MSCRAGRFSGLALALLHGLGPAAWAQPLESLSARSAVEFDNLALASTVVGDEGAIQAAAPLAVDPKLQAGLDSAGTLKTSISVQEPPGDGQQPAIFGPEGVPRDWSYPIGIGPVSKERQPGYFKGLLGGLLGLVLAPVALALELVQYVALTPVRMIKGLVQGKPLELLDPLRVVKNVVFDVALTAAGMLNSASAPVWNALRPDEATDFQYANNRLIFQGGPLGGLAKEHNVAAWVMSMHTVFPTRGYGYQTYQHEFVHNRQVADSFLAERAGEDYKGFKGWRDSDAHSYLNW